MTTDINKILDNIEADLNLQFNKLQLLRKNTSRIEYWEDHGDGGYWRPFTEDVAAVSTLNNYRWRINELRVNMWKVDDEWYLVKTDNGIQLLNKEEYGTFMGDTVVLYKGSYEDCKNFIKVF